MFERIYYILIILFNLSFKFFLFLLVKLITILYKYFYQNVLSTIKMMILNIYIILFNIFLKYILPPKE